MTATKRKETKIEQSEGERIEGLLKEVEKPSSIVNLPIQKKLPAVHIYFTEIGVDIEFDVVEKLKNRPIELAVNQVYKCLRHARGRLRAEQLGEARFTKKGDMNHAR